MDFWNSYSATELQTRAKLARLRAEAEQARLLPHTPWRLWAAASLRALADRLEPARKLSAPGTYPYALPRYMKGRA
ncbi:MAG: hypothetical protein M3498_02135 [Deinococcota bacterium]|jgi:hypothetical protein|nr:hypothetical protein [Deinococcota bacterium]